MAASLTDFSQPLTMEQWVAGAMPDRPKMMKTPGEYGTIYSMHLFSHFRKIFSFVFREILQGISQKLAIYFREIQNNFVQISCFAKFKKAVSQYCKFIRKCFVPSSQTGRSSCLQCCGTGASGAKIILCSLSLNQLFRLWLHGSAAEIIILKIFYKTVVITEDISLNKK